MVYLKKIKINIIIYWVIYGRIMLTCIPQVKKITYKKLVLEKTIKKTILYFY